MNNFFNDEDQPIKFSDGNFKGKILEKIDNNEPLTEYELKWVIFNYSIASILIEEHRWYTLKEEIVELAERTFKIEWKEGLTADLEDFFEPQVPIEVKGVPILIRKKKKATKWVELKK